MWSSERPSGQRWLNRFVDVTQAAVLGFSAPGFTGNGPRKSPVSSSSNTRVCRRASIVSISRTAVGQSERVECLRCLPHALISYYLSLLAAQLSASWPCRLQTPVHVRHEVQKTPVSFTCFIVFIHFRYFFMRLHVCFLFLFV